MKPARQSIILEIITQQDIETQNQLMEALAARGVKSTQATLSRDIKDMRLVKKLGGDGKYRYAVGGGAETNGYSDRLKKIFKECVTSFDIAQNIIVIKTLPGLADAACSTLDSMDIPELVGSLAGDDTAFLAMKDAASAESLCQEISNML
jgi:transcriptional regulator of arginine metabolism